MIIHKELAKRSVLLLSAVARNGTFSVGFVTVRYWRFISQGQENDPLSDLFFLLRASLLASPGELC